MMTIFIIGIIIFIIYIASSKDDGSRQNNTYTNYNKKYESDAVIRNELMQKLNKNIKVTVTTSSSSNNIKDNPIIDVTSQSTQINSNYRMIKYSSGVPKWEDKQIYSFSEITKATHEQIQFYNFYKRSFINGDIVFLEGNTNYAFILMFELQSEYKKDKNLLKLETQFNKLGECYPAIKPYVVSFLEQKRQEVDIKSSSLNNYKNDSVIDVTGQFSKIRSNGVLAKYILGVPEWKNQYVYSFSEINQASNNQKGFYNIFKNSFLNGIYYDLYKNTNYAFILINDFKNEYEEDKNLLKLETQLKKIGEIYPDTKPYGGLILKQKKEEVNISALNNVNTYSNSNFYEEYWKLGSKYKDKLKLNEEEVKLLNAIYNPNNAFFNIEYCGLEILKLYIAVISALKDKYIQEETNIDKQFLAVADVIARKHFRYRNGSQNYKYCIETTPNEFYSHIFKCCENSVRELYGHKRKLNIDNYYTNIEAKTEFETKILSKATELLPILISKVPRPNENTDIELYTINTSRWKIKFEQLTANYNDKPQEFIDSIISLGKLNKKNPSVENIFFEASKFIAKYDNESALSLYIHYLYQDLKSATFDNKQHTKTIQKSLFKTNEQLHDFEKIVSELIKDKDLEKALKQIPEIYKIKRKKIQFNTASINEIQKKHSETVEFLNEYLKDDFEEDNNSIKSQQINKEEVHQSTFVSELTFSAIHTTALELFAKSNFSVSQSELEVFAKSKGVFKSQLIESINDTCYEFLDDILIEEEEDYYTINTNYFQRISTK
ncbi:tellurite resistance TerB C-terminal domain-containing protein [Flavobacterium sp. XS2P24]|uniref:tellurite resistance TerB C-terminal domain-containing protein n=1 Tax=Flavobacterium sp. XS2P24 TaxID=3041249 RepID=UPI0024A93574|nr:tellurite resistance TerB C-terminal domain-containing protein [Flavobacterium sp. XS2P24]MDI6049003.1 tellurite resistance TerB C-terminal domain-containing protein [Flavobacterium sp. XS2P24]